MDTKIKRENFVVVQGWMLTDLKLKGNELIIYACIYGFSQAEGQSFSGSLQYLCDWTNSTKQGVMKCLKSLVEKKYIVKEERHINGVKFCEYRTTELHGVKLSLPPPIKQSLPNKKDKENIDNILSPLLFPPEVEKAVREWLDYKKEKGQSYKSKGLSMLLAKIKKMLDEKGAMAVVDAIEYSISNNYAGIYEPRTKKQGGAESSFSTDDFFARALQKTYEKKE